MPRPPVWTIYNLDGSISTSVNPPGLMIPANDDREEALPIRLKRAPMLKHENRKLSAHNLDFSDLKLQSVYFDKKVMKMGEVFMDRPLIVNMMQVTEPEILPRPNSLRVPSSMGTNSRSVSDIIPPSDHIPSASVSGDSELQEDCSPAPNAESTQPGSAIENNTDYGHTGLPADATTYDPSYPLEDPDVILYQPPSAQRDEKNPANGSITTGIASDVLQEPAYTMFEGPDRSIERLAHYVDLRVRLTEDQSNPLMNYMTVGSFITYVGLTRFLDSFSGVAREFELPRKSRYLVADIYGDYWGLLIRLEPGLELGEIQPSSFLGRKSKPRAPERMRYPERTSLIGVRTDPKYIVYAPLCAFTLTANEETVQSQTEPSSPHGSVSTGSHGGVAQAAIRSYSNDAEAEAVRDRFTFIPKAVYFQYVAHFDRSRAKPDPITDRHQRPSRAENKKPSMRSRALALKSSAGMIKSAKYNTPTQNIKDFFLRKKNTNVVSVSPTAGFDDRPAPERAINHTDGDGPCSPSIVAACAPQIPSLLSSSSQSLSLGLPDEASDTPPAYFNSTRQREKSPLRIRDTNLRSIPLAPNENAAISGQNERQSPAELAVPMESSSTRALSNPTPKPKTTSPLTNPPSQPTEQKLVQGHRCSM